MAEPAERSANPTVFATPLRERYWHPIRWMIGMAALIILSLAVPLMFAIDYNSIGEYGKVWTVFLVTTLLYSLIFLLPILGGVSLLGILRGQVGGEVGPSLEDGLSTATRWARKAGKYFAIFLIGYLFAIFLLCFPWFSLQGSGGFAKVALALSPIVVIWAVSFFDEAWVIKWMGWAFCTALILSLLLWAIFNIFPTWRQSPQQKEVENAFVAAEKEAKAQNDAKLQKEALPILKEIQKNTPENAGKSLEERIAQLPEAKREILRKAQSSSGTFGNIVSQIKAALPEIPSGTPAAPSGASVAAPAPYKVTLDFRADNLKGDKLCGISDGKRKFHIPYHASVLIEGRSVDLASFIRINGVRPGESLDVSGGCVKVTYRFADASWNEKEMQSPQTFAITFESAI